MTPEIGMPAWVLIVLYVWSLLIKGIALWRSAHLKQRNWFIAMLVVNSIGIVELVYLFKFATKPLTIKEIRYWLPKGSKQ